MPTTALAGTTAPSRYSQTGAVVTLTAADTTDSNHIAASGQPVVVVAHNTSTNTAYTVTITSVAAAMSLRTGNVAAQSLAAEEVRMFRLAADGWADTSSNYLIAANNAAVKIGWFLG